MCICLLGFSGAMCETAVPVVPGAFNQTVVIDVVVGENYDEAYDNPTSDEYKGFVNRFVTKMRPKYEGVPHFKYLNVTGLSRADPASTFDRTALEIREAKAAAFHFKASTDNVKVSHDVVLEVNNGNQAEQYQEGFKKVKEILEDLKGSNDITGFTATEKDLDMKGLCENALRGSGIAEYFSPYQLKNDTIVCRSRCDREHLETIQCHNGGICNIYKALGEICICRNVNDTWYLGEDCNFPIQKVAFYAGLSVTLAVLLVAVVTLVAYAVVSKHKHTKKKDMKQKLVNQWLDDDYEWTRAASPIGQHGAKNGSIMHRNQQTPFTYGSNRSNPTERMPQNQHRQDSFFPNPGYAEPAISPPPNMDFWFNLPMRTVRPETRGSWDV
ncbi:mucin-12-like [Xiphophorus couchianus]|uniref:mucin-12-like n=1 Tax=Xiphophorus couchianus TaxID=32473 RepID=UPI001015D6E5|nr:mucin-12-like [Xiphophorus couchianus]